MTTAYINMFQPIDQVNEDDPVNWDWETKTHDAVVRLGSRKELDEFIEHMANLAKQKKLVFTVGMSRGRLKITQLINKATRAQVQKAIKKHEEEFGPLPKKSELWPDGRWLYYEGDDPKAFVAEMKAKFEFDPSADNPEWNKEGGYCFDCPVHLIDQIYGGDVDYHIGS
jgi:hypothetical protein